MNYNNAFLRDLKHTQVYTEKIMLNNIQKNEEHIPYIKFGSKNIDNVLNGGFYPQNSYIIFGANKTGKTQICHHICVQAYYNSIKSVFLDTENTFRPERVNELSLTRNLKSEDVLKNILVSKILSNNALQLKLNELENIIISHKIQLLIIDSINNYYRLDIGSKHFSNYQTKSLFYGILEQVNNLTNKYNLITLLTAQISPSFSADSNIKEIPVGQQFLNHFFSEFLYLSYKEEDKGYIHYVKSSMFPEKKVLYKITKSGVKDYKI